MHPLKKKVDKHFLKSALEKNEMFCLHFSSNTVLCIIKLSWFMVLIKSLNISFCLCSVVSTSFGSIESPKERAQNYVTY